MYEKLFTPGKIGNITVKNRLVMSPMGIGLAELDGSPSEDMLAFYEARAMGGAGLIIPEITRVNDVHGAGLMRQLSVTQDRHIPAWPGWPRWSISTGLKSSSSSITQAGKRSLRSPAGSRLSPPRPFPANTFNRRPGR